MNPCIRCGNKSWSDIVIFTETTFGQGDSTHKCYVKCGKCGAKSREFSDWGLFEDTTLRAAQLDWNDNN